MKWPVLLRISGGSPFDGQLMAMQNLHETRITLAFLYANRSGAATGSNEAIVANICSHSAIDGSACKGWPKLRMSKVRIVLSTPETSAGTRGITLHGPRSSSNALRTEGAAPGNDHELVVLVPWLGACMLHGSFHTCATHIMPKRSASRPSRSRVGEPWSRGVAACRGSKSRPIL